MNEPTSQARTALYSLGQKLRRQNGHAWLVGTLLLWMAANMLTAITRKSITADEIIHIPAGYYHLVAGNYMLNNEHPPLAKMIAALPLLFIQPNEWAPDSPPGFDPQERSLEAFSRFFEANAALFETISFWTRVPMVLLTLLLGCVIYFFARAVENERAGVLAVALFAFEPTILAHGRVVHNDVPAALAYVVFAFGAFCYGQRPNLRRAVVLGLATGVALVTKFSLVLVGPLLLAVCMVTLIRPGMLGLSRSTIVKHAAATALTAFLIINLAYRFQHGPLAATDIAWVGATSPAHSTEILESLRLASSVLPTYFLFGIYNVTTHNHYGHAAYLLGEYRDTGWWYYFPVAFALKTPLPFLLVAISGVFWSLWRLLKKRDWRFIYLLVPLGAYTALTLTTGINIGIRHLLPAYPFFFILGGLLLDAILRPGRRRALALIAVGLCTGTTAFEAVRAFPDYIPYVNQLAGNAPAWRLLSDSNVEWGDDVQELASYLRARGETRVSAITSAGWLTARFYGLEYIDLLKVSSGQAPETNYVAIGASFLNGATVPKSATLPEEERRKMFAEFRDRQPEAIFGGSIYLYRVR